LRVLGAWRDAASALGLRPSPGLVGSRMCGPLDGADVLATELPGGVVRVLVARRSGPKADLPHDSERNPAEEHLASQAALASTVFKGPRVRTGDPIFDQRVELYGPRLQMIAGLEEGVRNAFRAADNARIGPRLVEAEWPLLDRTPESVAECIRNAVQL